jgi:nitrate/TMAO reductase-like tetraheme cytochrome c subunit
MSCVSCGKSLSYAPNSAGWIHLHHHGVVDAVCVHCFLVSDAMRKMFRHLRRAVT